MNNLPDYLSEDVNGPYFAWRPAKDEPVRPAISCIHYLYLGKRRTYKYVADYFQLSLKTIERYALKYNWKQRAYLFDKMIYRLSQNRSYIDWEQQQEAMFALKCQYTSVAHSNATEILVMLEYSEIKYKDERVVQRLEFIKKATFTLKHIFKMTDFKPPDSILMKNNAINAQIKKEFELEDLALLHKEKDYVYYNVELRNYNPADTMDENCYKCRFQDDPNSMKSFCKSIKKDDNSENNRPEDDESLDDKEFFSSYNDSPSADPVPVSNSPLSEGCQTQSDGVFHKDNISSTAFSPIPSEPQSENEATAIVPVPNSAENVTEESEEAEIEDFNDCTVWHDPIHRDHSNDPDDDPEMVAALDEAYNRWVISPDLIEEYRGYDKIYANS